MSGDATAAYLATVAGRLDADGCRVTRENWNGAEVLIGYRSDFKLRWMATRLHLFTIVTAVDTVTAAGLAAFTESTLDYAIGRKGELRGFQSGVAVLPGLIGARVEPAAAAWAAGGQRMRFAAMARPVVVDTSSGTVSCYRGTGMLGGVYAGHFRRKIDTYFPPPAG